MNARGKSLRRPQRIWLRKALFQAHLLAGLTVGLYLLLMSLSGSILVFNNEFANLFSRRTQLVSGFGPQMSDDELKRAAEQAHPESKVELVIKGNPDEPVEIWLAHGKERVGWLFNPYTGADMGSSERPGYFLIEWLADFHTNLLHRHAGRLINSVAGLGVTLLCLTGAMIWWPGIDGLRSSLAVDWKTNPKRRYWTLHTALGVWCFAFVLIWGISGIYLSNPNPFDEIVDFLSPVRNSLQGPRFGDQVLLWLANMHFGRFAGLPGEIVFSLLGLVPAALFATGTLMWWNRVLKPWLGSRETPTQAEIHSRSSRDFDKRSTTLS